MPDPPATVPASPPLTAVGLLSASVLAYEVLLMRLFAIAHWHHFAFMMISIALLGYGASGTLLAWMPSLTGKHLRPLFLTGAIGFSLASVLCAAAARRLPFNALEIFWGPEQWGYLAGIYGLLFLPFFLAATGIGAVLRFHRLRVAQIYAADLGGAAIGVCLAAGILFRLPPAAAVVVVSAGGAAAALGAAFHWQVPGRGLLCLSAAGWLGLAGLGAAHLDRPVINAYKPLAQALRVPETRRIYERHHPMGLFSAVVSPSIPFRRAPGLSLNSTAHLPEQVALFIDGQAMHVVDRYRGRSASLDYLRQTTASIGLQLHPRPKRVLIADAGGGQEILRAIAYQAQHIDAVDPHPLFPRLLQGPLREFSGWRFLEGRVRYHTNTVRGFLSSSPNTYDLIQLATQGDSGGAASAFGLNTLLTQEGLRQLWQHLNSDGLLVIPLWLRLPPRNSLKAFLTALVMLETRGVPQPADHLAMIRDWRTAVLVVGRSALSKNAQEHIREFSRRWGFDLVYLPGIREDEVNRHNVLAEPLFADGARALAGPGRDQFRRQYKFDLRPAVDDRPFFGHFFKWRTLPEIAALRSAGGVTLLDWGYPVLVATLIQAALFSLLLIGIPARRVSKAAAGPNGVRPHNLATLFYFGCIGGGFLFLEMAYMQRLTLALHHPLMATTLTLGGFLLGAGAGSAAAHQALRKGLRARRLLGASLAMVCAVGLVQIAALPWLLQRLGGMGIGINAAAALGLILPLAIAMGLPFPLGIALLARNRPALIPWAWGINGCATVISAVAAPLLAIAIGYRGVMGIALCLYAAGFLVAMSVGDSERNQPSSMAPQ